MLRDHGDCVHAVKFHGVRLWRRLDTFLEAGGMEIGRERRGKSVKPVKEPKTKRSTMPAHSHDVRQA